MNRDAVDIAELEHDTPRVDRYEIAETKANFARDDIVALKTQLAVMDRSLQSYAVAVTRTEASKRLLDAALAQIDRQYGFNPLDHEQTK